MDDEQKSVKHDRLSISGRPNIRRREGKRHATEKKWIDGERERSNVRPVGHVAEQSRAALAALVRM
jgi:hypothetical protein